MAALCTQELTAAVASAHNQVSQHVSIPAWIAQEFQGPACNQGAFAHRREGESVFSSVAISRWTLCQWMALTGCLGRSSTGWGTGWGWVWFKYIVFSSSQTEKAVTQTTEQEVDLLATVDPLLERRKIPNHAWMSLGYQHTKWNKSQKDRHFVISFIQGTQSILIYT